MHLVTCLRILCTPLRRSASLQVQYTWSRCQHFQAEPVSEANAGRRSHRRTSRNCGVSSLPMLPLVRYMVSGKGNGEKVETLQDVARLILNGQCRQIVVMAGAGISTPSGIPDFRSAGSGLYDSLKPLGLPYPEAVFDIQYFAHDPKPFFAVAQRLCPGSCRPNYTHYFARLLHDKGLLLRLYTQNIDGLERKAGIPPERLVEAHGSFATATCTACRQSYGWDQLRDDVLQGRVPLCAHCAGVVKPDIVFFGEQLPLNFNRHLIDFPLADLLIILGTSLEVQPFANLSEQVRRSVPRLLINQDAVGSLCRDPQRSNDVAELGDVVRGVRRFADLLGWSEEISQLLSREHQKLENVGEPPSH